MRRGILEQDLRDHISAKSFVREAGEKNLPKIVHFFEESERISREVLSPRQIRAFLIKFMPSGAGGGALSL